MPPVMLSPPIIVSLCAYTLEIPVASKNPVVDNAMAPITTNALNTTKVAMFILDDMLDTVKNLRLYSYCLMVFYRIYNILVAYIFTTYSVIASVNLFNFLVAFYPY